MGGFAVVFAGRNGIDQFGLRANVVRIPEVSMRLREAQTLIDRMQGATEAGSIDLHTYMTSEDSVFLRNIRLKTLAAAIVQVGLFDRLMKKTGQPDVYLGSKGSDSALAVITGRISFSDLVTKSPALVPQSKPNQEVLSTLIPVPLLSGLPMAEYEAVIASDLRSVGVEIDPKKLLNSMINNEKINRVISVGPIPLVSLDEQESMGLTAEDSIARDPGLAWFWSDVRSKNLAV